MRIETERLIIRYFNEDDGTDLYDYLSRKEVVRYEPYDVYTREEALVEAGKRACNHDFFAVQLKNGKMIGNLYFSIGEYGTWELGYVFHCDYWGKGYAFESTSALISHAYSGLGARRIISMCNPENQASWKLLERLGFRREGTLLKNIYFFTDENDNPIWQDTFEYGLLKEEWKF